MAGGFRSVAPWLGLSSQPSVTQGGFRTVLPLFPAGGTAAVEQGGFRTVLPLFPAGGTAAVEQGGFRTVLPLFPAGGAATVTQGGFRGLLGFWIGGAANAPVIAPPPSGGGHEFLKYDTLNRKRYHEKQALLTKQLRDEDEIIAMCVAQLIVKGIIR